MAAWGLCECEKRPWRTVEGGTKREDVRLAENASIFLRYRAEAGDEMRAGQLVIPN